MVLTEHYSQDIGCHMLQEPFHRDTLMIHSNNLEDNQLRSMYTLEVDSRHYSFHKDTIRLTHHHNRHDFPTHMCFHMAPSHSGNMSLPSHERSPPNPVPHNPHTPQAHRSDMYTTRLTPHLHITVSPDCNSLRMAHSASNNASCSSREV